MGTKNSRSLVVEEGLLTQDFELGRPAWRVERGGDTQGFEHSLAGA